MSFNVQQQKVINHYREMYNISSVISDDVVVEIIKRDMIQSGKVYAGFESLVQSAAESHQNGVNTGVFGFGFNNEENIELALSNDNSQYLTLLPTREELQALSFMQRILQESENILTEREKEAGPVSAFTNFFRTIVFSEYSKRSVKKEVKEFEKQLKEIEKAVKGEKIYRDFLGNASSVTFKDEFKKLRGVEFNADKITATMEKSAEVARIKTCYQSIQEVKKLLGYSTSGMYNITHPQEATSAILQAFDVLGVTKGQDKANLIGEIFNELKDHPIMKKYNCNGLTFDKNSNGEYCLYRYIDNKNGFTEAPMDVIQLVVGEIVNRLDKALATGLNIEFDENTTPDELSKLCNETIGKHEEEYQKMFAESFGGKNVKELSDEYVLKQQQDVATVEMIGKLVCMALMLLPGGVTATSGWLLKTGKFAQTAEKMTKVGTTLTKVQKIASPLIMGNMILSPTQLIEQGFSENGFSDEELDEWKNRVVQNSVYMAAGMTSANVAAKCAAQYKTARLVQALKTSGKSFDEIQAMIKANPTQFSDDIVKEFAKISKQGMYRQIGAEIAFDLSSTVALNLIMGNGTLTKTEVINSIIFAISGGTLQKQFAPLSTETKIAFLMDNFKDYGITYADAVNILKTMDDISAGVNVGVNKGVNEGDDVDNIIPKSQNDILKARQKALKEKALQRQSQETATPVQKLEKGYILDSKTGKPIKVDMSKATSEVTNSQVSISDEFGNLLGVVNYDRVVNLNDGSQALHFQGLVSNVEGVGVGTRLIEELVKISENMGFEGRLAATASSMRADKLTNLGFYYKLGFEATDAQKHSQILDCIQNKKEIPIALNHDVDIVFNPKKAVVSSKISLEEATKILTEKIQHKTNISELIPYLKVFKSEDSILDNLGGISFYDVNGIHYYFDCDGQGNIIKFCVTDANYNIKNYIYNKSGKAIEVDVKIYNRTQPEFRITEERRYIIENSKLFPEETRRLILQDGNHFYTKENIDELSSLLKTDEDIAIANKLLMTKGPEKGYLRAIGNALNLSQQKFGVNDIIKVLKSEDARQKVLNSIKDNTYVKKTELEPFLHGEKFDTFAGHKLTDENDISYKTKDMTIKDVDDICSKYYYDSKIRNQINSQVPDGEAVCINGKMYCRAGAELIPINLSKATFEKLFPVEERFNISQGELGDCYFIAELSGYLATPNGRAALYSAFNEVGDDIIIKFPKFENVEIKFKNGELNKLSPISIYKKDGNLKFGSYLDQTKACDGIKMIEQAFAFVRNLDTETETTIVVNDKFLMNKQMQNLDGGGKGETTSLYKNAEVISHFSSIGFTLDGPKTVEDALEIFAKELEKNPNVFGSVGFLQKISVGSGIKLITGHLYRIVDYDTATQTVKIVNPHDSSKYFDVPLEAFKKAEPEFSIWKIEIPKTSNPKIPDFVVAKMDTKFTADDVDKAIENILNFYKKNADELRKNFEQKGFFDLGRAQSRVKGEASLRDKIVDYLKKHPNATHLDIWQEIRDCFACRTIIQEGDFTKHPEVTKILETGDKKAAVLKAAELQSQEAVNTIKRLIDDNVRGDNKVKAARFTNYVSKDGIPYLSENQLAEIKQYAADRKIKLDIVSIIDQVDPKYAEIIQTDGKPTTRSQPSGYTALQMNFIYENGAVFEWQYRGEAVNKFAEAEHIAYDARTGKGLTGGDPKLEELYSPIQKLLNEKSMPEDVYNKYNEYLNAYYYHCRLLELGFESTPPKLSDYEIMGYKFDPILEAEGLMKLHDVADALKADRISGTDAKRIINNFKKGIDEFVPMSETDFALVLKNLGYDDETIKQVDLNNIYFQTEINTMLVLKETIGQEFETIYPKDLIDMSKEVESDINFSFVTKNNMQLLKDKFGSKLLKDDIGYIFTSNNTEIMLKLIKGYSGEEKLTKNIIDFLSWSDRRYLKELTPERFEAYVEIINSVNEGFMVSARNLDLVDLLISHPEINDNKIIFDMLSNCALQLGKIGDQKDVVRILLSEVEDCVNNYSKYKDLNISDFTKTTLGLIKKLAPENQDNAIKLIETLESKLKCDYETAILITRYLNKHPNLDFADFTKFVETVDFNKLTELVPDFAKYTDNDKINFLDFHYQNGTKEFNAETLTLKGDLTTFLAQNYLGENLGTLLAIFPKTDRNIGTLPKGWCDEPIKAIEAETEIRNAIDIFRQKVEDKSGAFNYDETVVEPAIKDLENKLILILGKKVEIKRLDAGSFGTGYKISVEGSEPVVLKIYHKNQNPSTELEHGQRAEIPLGPFLNEHSNNFVHFYFGKVPDNYTKDGFVVTEFLKEGEKPKHNGNYDSNYQITSEDSWQGHNIIANKIIDYGAVRVAPENGTKFFRFDDLIDKNE